MTTRRSSGALSSLDAALENVQIDESCMRSVGESSPEPPSVNPVIKTKSMETRQPKKGNFGRVLDPGRKKLTAVESQRVLAVLDDSIKRIEMVTLLPYISGNLYRFSVVLGDELVTAIEQHAYIKTSYTDTCDRLKLQSSLKSVSSSLQGSAVQSKTSSRQSSIPAMNNDVDEMQHLTKEEEEQLKKTLYVLKQQMGFSTRNILRLLSLNPAAVNTVRAERQSRDQESSNLITYMNELRGFILDRLLMTPLEEKDEIDYLSLIGVREKRNCQIFKRLSAELQAAEDKKKSEIAKQNEEIRRLKADLNQTEQSSEEYIRLTKSESEKQQQADTKSWAGKQGKLEADLQALKSQLTLSTTANRQQELVLRKKKFKIEIEVENWIQKYDDDLGELQNEFEDADAVYTEEKAKLNELEERIFKLEPEYINIKEQKKKAREIREKTQREWARNDAATKFQRLWKEYRHRKALNAKKNKGKKKKTDKK